MNMGREEALLDDSIIQELRSIAAMTPDQVYRTASSHLNASLIDLKTSAGFNLDLVSASGCYLYERTGIDSATGEPIIREIMDWGQYGVISTGHNHPRIGAAIQYAISKQLPNMIMTMVNRYEAKLAEKLAKLSGLQNAFLVVSGTGANDAAMKAAMLYTGKEGFVAEEGSFFGKGIGPLSMGKDHYKRAFGTLLPNCHTIPFEDLVALEELLSTGNIAAFFIEIVQGENGAIPHTEEFLLAAAELCKRYGVLFVVDEVQTGFGRTGETFAYQHFGLKPDMVTLAKVLGGAYLAMGAVLFTSEVASVFDNMENMLYNSGTFSGYTLGCVTALAAIKVMEEEKLAENARIVGDYLLAGLRQIAQEYPDFITDVTGKGLMAAMHFRVPAGMPKEEAKELIGAGIVRKLLGLGHAVIYSLNNPSRIRLVPPLAITTKQVDGLFAALREVLSKSASTKEIVSDTFRTVTSGKGALATLAQKTIRAKWQAIMRGSRLVRIIKFTWTEIRR